MGGLVNLADFPDNPPLAAINQSGWQVHNAAGRTLVVTTAARTTRAAFATFPFAAVHVELRWGGRLGFGRAR